HSSEKTGMPRARPHAASASRSPNPPVGLEGEFDHNTRARAASDSSIAPRSSPPTRPGEDGTGTARPPARAAPMGYGGEDTAGYSTVSRPGCRRRSTWGTDATSSLVPTQAPTEGSGTPASPKRRSSQAAAAPSRVGLPAEAG